ncbi:hypothetical protein WQ57_18255 [Mesobacillus campisalis]|uniref:Uncharacterized protein n=1 Tax=Mesobacillus campisalis TaxID=1408103 RepID=A0A0M2SSC3_9BACI|nr:MULTISPECIES: hypothetical protein [Bacillaceae]KKK36596.1 hypothetical protein WQ57_18255 [Mesobacillus campisalis]
MLKKLELSDYQLWMCAKIKEKLTEDPHAVEYSPAYHDNVEEREVISLALSEMLYRLGGLDPQMKKID